MEYMDAINEAFALYDEIENELRVFARISDAYTSITRNEEAYIVDVEYMTKEFEAKVEITRNEIYQRVLSDNVTPREAICSLLKEKVCLAAHDIQH